MKKLIVANWKLNPVSQAKAIALARAYRKTSAVICPPFVHLAAVRAALKGGSAKLGAQDVFWEEAGAYTGGVSAPMLKDAGVSYVIIGHSERRGVFGESDTMINRKVLAALGKGLSVILCVGESREVRDRGIGAAQQYVERQLFDDLKGIAGMRIPRGRLVIAYEPIWAIGTGQADKPEETREMVVRVKAIVRGEYGVADVPVLYGGSVTSANVDRMIEYADGALVGGASLKPDDFLRICAVASGSAQKRKTRI